MARQRLPRRSRPVFAARWTAFERPWREQRGWKGQPPEVGVNVEGNVNAARAGSPDQVDRGFSSAGRGCVAVRRQMRDLEPRAAPFRDVNRFVDRGQIPMILVTHVNGV